MNDEFRKTMVHLNLDLDTLRTLVISKDLGGYGRAAIHLGRTPSAISLQMKRLQEDVGVVLFLKKGRTTELTEAGEIVLRYGRKILSLNDELLDTLNGASLAGTVRIGFTQDFAETVLSKVLFQFGSLYPLIQIEVLIEANMALVDAVEKGRLDLAVVVGEEDRASAEILGELELVWIAGQNFCFRKEHPLPLVLLGPQCAFRKTTIAKLEQAGFLWRLAAVSPSVTGLWAAATGGLGITGRSSLGIPPGLIFDSDLFGLPQLGSFPVTLHSQDVLGDQGIQRLRMIIRDAVIEMLNSTRTKKKRGVNAARRTKA